MRRRLLRGLAMTFLLLFICGIANIPKVNAQERIKLIKTQENPAVYFVDKENVRHAFPNREVYESWYGSDFSKVVTVSKEYLESLNLGRNVTWKPGKALLKVPSSPVVYAVEPGGVLRAIKNEEVAKTIFGNKWYQKVRALPEIFFQNYTIGKHIANHVDVPDGWIVMKATKSQAVIANERERSVAISDVDNRQNEIASQGLAMTNVEYYIKWRGVLQRFESVDVLKKNGYAETEALMTDSNYFSVRFSEIQDSVERFVDPSFSPNVSSLSCDLHDLKLGIVVVSDRTLTQGEIGVLHDAIFQLPQYYSDATDSLGSIAAENNVVIMSLQNAFDDREHSTLRFEEVAQTYYDVHEDDVDFLAVFHTVYQRRQQQGEIARYIPVSNSVNGVGRHIFNRANQFGSIGKLKGVLDMGNISQYAGDVGKGPNLTLGTLVHEIMHSVSGSLIISDGSGNTSDILLGYEDPFHWSRFLLETSFLGGDGWAVDNSVGAGFTSDQNGQTQDLPLQDGTRGIFVSHISSDSEFRRKFSNLDLYAFGFIPARSVGPIQYLATSDRSNSSHRVEGAVKTVNMDQVLVVNGKRECVVK